ncbi:hypothetical protein NKH74_27840 [Mesorhizobium sp. M0933]|uniref:hypothetical protein n=1 Tax=Mesorhizobium sp. M0933 TaxID=2957030 RepID=UPI00333BA7E6
MKVRADGFDFCFTDAIDAFVFDEKDSAKQTYHGAPMKGVDIVAEFNEAYVYIEVKDYDDPTIYDLANAATEEERQARQDSFRWLKNYLKYKFRDSYLYRHAEQKVEKPVHYICLMTFDNALNSRMQKSLKQELPVGKASPRWVQVLATSCQVMNLQKWNENFPKWPVTRVPAAAANEGAAA